jgi:hypothetical protein
MAEHRRAEWTWHYLRFAREAVARGFLCNTEIARILGVSPNTFMSWRERYPKLEKAIGEEMAELLRRVRCYERCAERTAIIRQCHEQLDSIMERTAIDYRDPPTREDWELITLRRRVEKRVAREHLHRKCAAKPSS